MPQWTMVEYQASVYVLLQNFTFVGVFTSQHARVHGTKDKFVMKREHISLTVSLLRLPTILCGPFPCRMPFVPYRGPT